MLSTEISERKLENIFIREISGEKIVFLFSQNTYKTEYRDRSEKNLKNSRSEQCMTCEPNHEFFIFFEVIFDSFKCNQFILIFIGTEIQTKIFMVLQMF